MRDCVRCGSKEVVKNGHSKDGQQRYKCKECGRSYGDEDRRVKYDLAKKMKVLALYLEGMGIRSIERVEKVPSPLIVRWIRKFSSVLQEHLQAIEMPEEAQQIEILEIDELFSYVQKKSVKPTYGWLLIGTEIKLLLLR